MSKNPILALAAALLLTGCVGDKAEYIHSVWRPAGASDVEKPVYYVTDREADRGWPGGFGKHWSDALSCGSVVAVIPPESLPGEPIPTGQHQARFRRERRLRRELRAQRSRPTPAPGTATRCSSTFTASTRCSTARALRAGQLALDTRSDCIAAVFSWSSEGEIGRYVADIEHSAYAAPELESFLRALAGAGLRIDIVGHSIGTRVALSALASMARHPDPPRDDFVGELILAAADVGADPVNNDFIHLLNDARPFVRRTTIYASAGDAVLAVSAVAHGDVPRAGHRPLGDRRLETHGGDHAIDVVDATMRRRSCSAIPISACRSRRSATSRSPCAGATVEQRLGKIDDWPVTLICKPPQDGAACDPALPHYALNIAPDRRPDFWVRLVRRLAPLVPRIELAPLTGSAE